jgi:hypothetical protein
MTRVLIGTSGWHYDSWRGPFYPGPSIQRVSPYRRNRNFTPANRGAKWRVLSNAYVQGRQKLEGNDGLGLCLCVEGVEIQHPLEATL